MSDPKTPPEDEDVAAFRRAVADVRPLPGGPRASAPRRAPRIAKAAKRAALLTTAPATADGTTARAAGDQLTFRRPTVREDVLRRLRRGEFRAEAELDLHGMRRLDAHAALTEFLTDSIAHGLRCVRVIHGKGLRSGPEGPVLKHVVDQWLRTVENVLAFTSARAVDGGSGALYVLLAPLPRTTR